MLTIIPNQFPHEEMYEITSHKLNENLRDYKNSTIAKILNYWLLGSVVNNIYDIEQFKEINPHIFRKDDAKTLSYAIRMKITISVQ